MALTVATNVASLSAYRSLSVTDTHMTRSLERLSSGFRIVRAADDAAGLAISESLRSQVSSLKVAVRNTQDGISVVQTAEGALTETHSLLHRMRDLAVQAANTGGLTDAARSTLQAEIVALKAELDRIAQNTSWNGVNLLDGSFQATFQVGANAGETISFAIGSGSGMDATGLGVAGVDVAAVAGNAMDANVVDATAGTAGTVTTTGLDFSPAAAGWEGLNGTVSVGGRSLDLATVTGAGGATPALADLQAAVLDAFGTDLTVALNGTDLEFTGQAPAGGATAHEVAGASVNFAQASGASAAIDLLDTAIQTVSTERADLGAIQNRFDHTINNLNVAVENLSASESRIRDADMAQEMVRFTRNQILTQAGTAMLAQANEAPRGLLELLR